jgi:VIT1/CCC1 family predicted Fe2+/Mn2+ transporter
LTDTVDSPRKTQYRAYLKAELEAAAAYKLMAEAESDSSRAKVFERLAQTELRHASRWAEKLGLDAESLKPAEAGFKLRLLHLAARMLGTRRVIPWLLRGEAKDMGDYASDPEALDFAREERHHARVLNRMANGKDGIEALRSERGHLLANGGNLRAAVLGINDGLVSNFSLVMGVAGGTDNAQFVLLAGVAGLLAGAFSMSAGEYVSVRSQRDLYEYQIGVERAELERWPEEEEEELALIYQSKGLSPEESRSIARQIVARPQAALDTLSREELGLDPSQLGSPSGAAASSFIAFVAGAIVPILPYIFDAAHLAFILSATLSAGALLTVGGALAVLTGKRALWGALRMLLAGGSAAAVTFGVGHLIGVSVGG